MALMRKASVKQEKSTSEKQTDKQKEIIDGSKLFSQKFREEFASQWNLANTEYEKKLTTLQEESAVYKKLQSVFAKTKLRYDYLTSFINEIVSSKYANDTISFKLTKGASSFLKFSYASTKADELSLAQTSEDIDSIATLFAKLENSTFANEDVVVNVPKSVFAALRFKFSSTFKNFIAKWIKNLENYKEVVPEPKPEEKPKPEKTKTTRTSTTAPRPKPKVEKPERPPKVMFIGVIVGHEITEDNKYTFTILDIRNKETFDITGKMSDGIYYKAFHTYADKCADGVVIPVICYNWHENIPNSPCMALYYDEDDYKEFDEQFNIKVDDLKVMFEEYLNR